MPEENAALNTAQTSLHAPMIGAAVFAIWLLLWPSVDSARTTEFEAIRAGLSPDARFTWFGFRIFGSVVITPIFEERAFGGFLQRSFVSPDFTGVSLKQLSVVSLCGSAI